MDFDPQQLAFYPKDPGVYIMKSQTQEILYIGKAKNIKTRLLQYFQHQDTRVQLPHLLRQVAFIETIVTLTEKEALLLERRLIQQHKPKYNILLKDDKQFISLLITKEMWPKVELVRYRHRPPKEGKVFGPYPHAHAARKAYEHLIKLYPLRQCSNTEFNHRTRPCILYDMQRCLGPCRNLCTQKEYQALVDGACRFLEGKDPSLLEDLHKEMEQASASMHYERAQTLYETIQHLTEIIAAQKTAFKIGIKCDVLGIAKQGHWLSLTLLSFQTKDLIQQYPYFLDTFEPCLLDGLITSFLLQHYTTHPIPSKLFVPLLLPDSKNLQEIFQIPICLPKKEEHKELLSMANRNAEAFLHQSSRRREEQEQALLQLQELLSLSRYPARIECLDTSHLAGSHPVAALVSFLEGIKDPKQQRLFQIRHSEQSEDYNSMKEALERHLTRAKQEETLPDLLILDGGKGQLHLAMDLVSKLDIVTIDLIALAKEKSRHDRGLTQEKVYKPDSFKPYLLPPRSAALFLLQSIRDEAHRSALRYHKKRRQKKLTESELDKVPGIGAAKKKKILAHFKSVRRLREATLEEIASTPGISSKDAKTLFTTFHRRSQP
jgi:excinuclease ABC subunit C